jgi:hypothetical protein
MDRELMGIVPQPIRRSCGVSAQRRMGGGAQQRYPSIKRRGGRWVSFLHPSYGRADYRSSVGWVERSDTHQSNGILLQMRTDACLSDAPHGWNDEKNSLPSTPDAGGSLP